LRGGGGCWGERRSDVGKSPQFSAAAATCLKIQGVVELGEVFFNETTIRVDVADPCRRATAVYLDGVESLHLSSGG